jgi:hypothetical protein
MALSTTGKPAIGGLHRIDISLPKHPKAYHPSIGDIVQCYIPSAIASERTVEHLQPTITGISVSVVAVVNTSSPELPRTEEVSLFLVPRQVGLSRVSIEVLVSGETSETYLVTFLVNQNAAD